MGLFGHESIALAESNTAIMLETTINYFENVQIFEESFDIVTEGKVSEAFSKVCEKIRKALKFLWDKVVEIFNKIKGFISSKIFKKAEEDAKEAEAAINNSAAKDIKVDSMPSDEEIEKMAEDLGVSKEAPAEEKPEEEPKDIGVKNIQTLKSKLEKIMNLKLHSYAFVDINKEIRSHRNYIVGQFLKTHLDRFMNNGEFKLNRYAEEQGAESVYDWIMNSKDLLVVDPIFFEKDEKFTFESIKKNINDYCKTQATEKFPKFTVSSLLKYFKDNIKQAEFALEQINKEKSDIQSSIKLLTDSITKLESQSLNAPTNYDDRSKIRKQYSNARKAYGEDNEKTKELKQKYDNYQKTHSDYQDKKGNWVAPGDIAKMFSNSINIIKLDVQLYGFLSSMATTQVKQINNGIKLIRSLAK